MYSTLHKSDDNTTKEVSDIVIVLIWKIQSSKGCIIFLL